MEKNEKRKEEKIRKGIKVTIIFHMQYSENRKSTKIKFLWMTCV
jgi:hypothetical protein